MKIKDTIKVAQDNNMPCLLVGAHGTGKSYGIKQAAEKAKKKLSRIIVTQETTPEDLVFGYELKDGETKKVKRELLKAVEKGEWIVLEELNMASPAVLTMLNGLLETDPESRYLRYLNKEIKPHKDFRLFATSNPTSYSGANRMNDALLSRFIINKVQPDYKYFLRIIKKEYADNEDLHEECKRFVSAVSKAKKNYEIYISPRELLVYAKLRSQGYKQAEALGFVLDRFYDEDAEILEDVAALFEVERDREEILVLNSVELKKMVDDKTQDIRIELEEKTEQVKQLKKYEKLMKKIQSEIN